MIPFENMPSIFVSHGAPDLPISGHLAADFLKQLPKSLPRPEGVVVISAHWVTHGLQLTSVGPLETIYDFYGFPPELNRIKYPAEGKRTLIDQVSVCLRLQEHKVTMDLNRGLDHGAWVPLHLMYPEADIPVVQLSLDGNLSAKEHLSVGRALSTLRQSNILVIASGGSVHNLRAIAPEGSPTPDWALSFEEWLDETLCTGEFDKLTSYRSLAPNARLAHPSDEHFLPLIVAAGAGGASTSAQRIHHSYSYGSIGMGAWLFN